MGTVKKYMWIGWCVFFAAGCGGKVLTELPEPTTNPSPTNSGSIPQFVPYPSDSVFECDAGASLYTKVTLSGSWLLTTDGPKEQSICIDTLDTQVGVSNEISYACYRQCVEQGKCTVPNIDPADTLPYAWDDWRRATVSIGYLTWMEMNNYCTFLGGRLPTWAELRALSARDQSGFYPLALFTRAIDCWADWGIKSNQKGCLSLEQQVWISDNFQRNDGSTIWDPLDREWLVQNDVGGAANLFGGLPERTASHIYSDQYCTLIPGSEHLVYSPVSDLYEAFKSKTKIAQPRQINDEFRSYKLGFRCASH
jgi:hypothetical protein